MHKRPTKKKAGKKSNQPAKSVRELIKRVMRIIEAESGRPFDRSGSIGQELNGMQAPLSIWSNPDTFPILVIEELEVQQLKDQAPKGHCDYIVFKRGCRFPIRLGPASSKQLQIRSGIMAKPNIRPRTGL